MARTGRNGAPWTLLDGALHRLNDKKNGSQRPYFKIKEIFRLLFFFHKYARVNKFNPKCFIKTNKMDLLNEVVHGCLSIASHINQPLQMLRPPDGKYHLGICVFKNSINTSELKRVNSLSCVAVDHSRRPALGGSTMAVTLGDTRALRMLGNTSSAFPQWNSTLLRPSDTNSENGSITKTEPHITNLKRHFHLSSIIITFIFFPHRHQKNCHKVTLQTHWNMSLLTALYSWIFTYLTHKSVAVVWFRLAGVLPLSFALTLASSTASWQSSIPITFFTL